jgi:hypothetical protein
MTPQRRLDHFTLGDQSVSYRGRQTGDLRVPRQDMVACRRVSRGHR